MRLSSLSSSSPLTSTITTTLLCGLQRGCREKTLHSAAADARRHASDAPRVGASNTSEQSSACKNSLAIHLTDIPKPHRASYVVCEILQLDLKWCPLLLFIAFIVFSFANSKEKKLFFSGYGSFCSVTAQGVHGNCLPRHSPCY